MGEPAAIAARIVRGVLTQHARHDDGPKGAAARAELARRRAAREEAARQAWTNLGEAMQRTVQAMSAFASAFAEGQRRATRDVGVDHHALIDAFERHAREVGHG